MLKKYFLVLELNYNYIHKSEDSGTGSAHLPRGKSHERAAGPARSVPVRLAMANDIRKL
jgi:hypothetical protein